jgi:DNA-binding transcriptional ArsR family regulator
MFESPPIARVCAAIGDPVRAAMLVALLDGRALTASELALVGGISPQTASSHLSKLLDEALVSVENQGRHRYFRLSGSDVAALLEQLMGVAERNNVKHPRTGPKEPALRRARVCYDHLAGEMGVMVYDSFVQRGWLLEAEGSLDLSPSGREGLESLGIRLDGLGKSRRPLCKSCVEWSMRRHHLAGSLGELVLHHCFKLQWAKRLPESRVVQFSARGEACFLDALVH